MELQLLKDQVSDVAPACNAVAQGRGLSSSAMCTDGAAVINAMVNKLGCLAMGVTCSVPFRYHLISFPS
jgi:hypothetical protein